MHSVKRTEEEPESLKNNKAQWTADLLNQIEIKKGKISSVDEKYKNQYKQEDVKKALGDMYDELCCYCEGHITLTGYEEIEHYKPKSKYPELCFEWTNLHQICQRCNKNKNAKWNDEFPILNPTEDEIEKYLFYKNVLLVSTEDDERAKITINHLKLNEEKFLNFRTELYKKALEYRERPAKDKACFRDLILTRKDYPTFKKYLISIVDGVNTY